MTTEDEHIGTENLTETAGVELLRALGAKPPEALGVAWCELWGVAVDKKTGEQKILHINNISCRSMVGPKDALDELMEALHYAKETYHLTPYLPSFQSTPAPAKTPQETPEQATTPQSPNPVAKPAENQSGNVSAPSGDPSKNVYHCIRMEVTPLPEDRATVGFFDINPGLRYAVLSVTNWPIASVLKLMPDTGEWTADKFRLANKFAIDWMVYFENSKKTNAKGIPLKDVTRIELTK